MPIRLINLNYIAGVWKAPRNIKRVGLRETKPAIFIASHGIFPPGKLNSNNCYLWDLLSLKTSYLVFSANLKP